MSSQPSIAEYFHLPLKQLNHLIFCSHEYEFVFISNLNSGDSSIVRNLYYLITDEYPQDDNVFFRNDTNVFQSFSSDEDANQLATLLAANRYLTFTFVRNPYTRILSTYQFMIEDLDMRRHRPFSMQQQFNVAEDYEMSFLEFLLCVREQEYRHMEAHWRPQSYATGIKGAMKYDFIGRVEQLDYDLTKVLRKLSQNIEFQIETDSNHRNNEQELLHQYYGYNEQALVEEIYNDDFKFFGYGHELPLR